MKEHEDEHRALEESFAGEKEWTLKVDGAVEIVQELRYDELNLVPSKFHVLDVGKIIAGMRGEGALVDALLEKAKPQPSATHLTFHASDGFAASVPLGDVVGKGIIVYKLEGKPLPKKFGWPTRVMIPKGPSECANVKSVVRIELTVGKGKDTTPVH